MIKLIDLLKEQFITNDEIKDILISNGENSQDVDNFLKSLGITGFEGSPTRSNMIYNFVNRFEKWKKNQSLSKAMSEKLDPVGKEDDDINNDGKVNKTDKHLANRRKAIAKNIKEGDDHEVAMAQASLKSIIKSSAQLMNKLGMMERDIPGWIQDHITNAENYIDQAAQGFHELNDNE